MVTSRRSLLRSFGIGTAVAAATRCSFGLMQRPHSQPVTESEAERPIYLDNNENAYGPSRRTAEAIRAACATVNRYPVKSDRLSQEIATFHSVKRDQVVLGCGSTEILRIAAQSFLGPGKQLLQSSPTFEALEFYARSVGADVISLPLTHEFAHDVQSMLRKVTSSTRLIYICNPNNPTGSITPRSALESFISKLPPTVCVLIDEAYHHYAGESSMYASFIDHAINNDRVFVSRTFSAVYGLAGLRLGYGIASAEVAQQLRLVATVNNVNAVVEQAAIAALADKEGVQDFVKQNADDRQEFFNQAMARMLKPIDSHTNFVMMNTNRPAKQVIEHFRQHGIMIAPRFPSMDTFIRVSLGAPNEMRQFWKVWDRLPNTGMRM
jgi:histidinol-phosphate aminotransferase